MGNHKVHTRARGFSAIEIVIVMVMAGILTAVAVPFIRNSTVKSSITGAMSAIASYHGMARNASIERGRSAVLVLNAASASVLVVLRRSGSTAVDTVGRVENLDSRFGVSFTTTADSVIFSPRGMGTAASSTTVIVSRRGFADTLVIAAAGRLLR